MSAVRPSWDTTWMSVAHALAKRSRCDRAHVGCVIVGADQSVLAASYNGPPPGYEVSGTCSAWCPRAKPGAVLDTGYVQCPTVHAEVNAAARAGNCAGATAYVTHPPCMGCAKTLAAAGVYRVVYVGATAADDHRLPLEVSAFLRASGVQQQVAI